MLDSLKTIITAFAAGIETTVIRSEQKGNKPAYPYVAYKVTDILKEKAHLAVIETKPKEGDSTKCIISYKGQCDLPISLTFVHRDASKIRQIVWKACDWWDDLAADVCEPLGITANRISDPQDRTVQLETDWEYKFGFDVKLSAIVARDREVDTIDVESILKTLILED